MSLFCLTRDPHGRAGRITIDVTVRSGAVDHKRKGIQMERSTELAALLQSIYTAVSNGDADTLSQSLTARDGLLFIGTDPNEWYDDAADVKTMLTAQASAGVTVRGGDIVAYEEGTVGWVADRGAFILPDGGESPFRITAVFHRENGHWKLVQEHASVAASNEQVIGTSLDT
jgi:hypothetical protein